MNQTIRYLNLTNGLEFLPEYPDARFVRIPSTSIEQNDWFSIFMELDHDLLFNLARGRECAIYDCGCRREVSKTISVGIPTIRGCLDAYWFNKPKPEKYVGLFEYEKGCNVDYLTRIKRKFDYYKRYLTGDSVKLHGVSKLTVHDGDREYYRQLASSGCPMMPEGIK